MSSKTLGKYYEEQAWRYLEAQGLKLITSNFTSRVGEIDLICLEQSILVFVEVRYRQKALYGNALESVNYSKQQKIKRSAEYFLLQHTHYQSLACRFDVLAIDQTQITWIKNAFY